MIITFSLFCLTFEIGNGDSMGTVLEYEAAGVVGTTLCIIPNPGICSLNIISSISFQNMVTVN